MLKILKKLRTASLNSEFIGSYEKKSVAQQKAQNFETYEISYSFGYYVASLLHK